MHALQWCKVPMGAVTVHYPRRSKAKRIIRHSTNRSTRHIHSSMQQQAMQSAASSSRQQQAMQSAASSSRQQQAMQPAAAVVPPCLLLLLLLRSEVQLSGLVGSSRSCTILTRLRLWRLQFVHIDTLCMGVRRAC